MINSQNTRKQLYWNTFARIPVQIISFAISIIVARILMPKDFGILGIAMMVVGYANIFTNFGFNQAIVQKNIRDKKTLDSIFTFDLAISLLLSFLFYTYAGYIAIFFKTPECKKVVQLMSIVFIISSFQALPHGILRRNMEFKTFALIETSQALLMSLFTLVFAILGFRYWALAFGQLFPLAIITIVLCIKAKWYPAIYYNYDRMKNVYEFGFWSFLKSQITFISQHVDKLVLGRFLGAVSLGFYDKSMSLAKMPADSILMNINAVMFSSFSRNQNSKEILQQQFKKALGFTAIISYPIYSGLILIAPYFVYGLLGEKWSPMILPFQIILFGFLFKSVTGIITNFNVAIGRYRSDSLRLMLSVFIFAIACFGLLRFGLNGIAISFVIYSFSLFILYTSLAISHVDLSWIEVIKPLLSGILPTVVMNIIVQLVSYYLLHEFSVLNLILLSSIGGVVYFVCLYLDTTTTTVEIKNILLFDIKKRIKFFSH